MNLQALSLGLYVHVPFCANACAYCHFLKMRPTAESINLYLKKIENECCFWQKKLCNRSINTIFWGGGSPSCLSTEAFYQLNSCFHFNTKHLEEWTVEISPVTITLEKLKTLKSIGVSRISMGVQSFNEQILQQLGRKQTLNQVYQAYHWIKEAGFTNVNFDLIFPPDFSSIDVWQQDLETAIKLSPEHLSTYCLTYENESGPFTEQHYKNVDINKEADFYEFTWQFLQDKGYEHYEVSNFSKPGYACKHNLNTWRMQEWIGFGPSAASQYQWCRFQNSFQLENWEINHYINEEILSEETLLKDCLIFGLRTCQGIDLTQLQRRFPKVDLKTYQPLWEKFQQEQLITLNNNILRCTSKGLLLADSLALEIL